MLIIKHWPTYPPVLVSTGSLRAQRFLSVRESISPSMRVRRQKSTSKDTLTIYSACLTHFHTNVTHFALGSHSFSV